MHTPAWAGGAWFAAPSSWQSVICSNGAAAPGATALAPPQHAAGHSVWQSWHHKQLPGTAHPIMLQLQQQQRQLVSFAAAQNEQQLTELQRQQQQRDLKDLQQQWQLVISRPVVAPPTQRALPHAGNGFVPLQGVSQQQLTAMVSEATTLQQLQGLILQVAAADKPDLTTRMLLQTVRIHRSSGSGSNTGLQGSNATTAQTPLQQQQQGQTADQQVYSICRACDTLLVRQAHRLQFQHVSGILWCWAQLGGRKVWGSGHDSTRTHSSGQLQRLVLRRLIECPVDRELSGNVSSIGSQLSRAATACAALHIYDPRVWDKLHHMIQALAPTLQPGDVSRCVWGLARARVAPRAKCQPAFAALLARAHSCTGAFGRVGALNVLWAIGNSDLVHLAPAGLVKALVAKVLGPECSNWQHQQQPEQQQGMQARQQPQQQCSSEVSKDDCIGSEQLEVPAQISPAAFAAARQAAARIPGYGLGPAELTCLVWSLASMSRHESRRATAQSYRHSKHMPQQQQQQQIRHKLRQLKHITAAQASDSSSSSGNSAASASATSTAGQDVQLLLQLESGLIAYLATAVRCQLPDLGCRQVATLARAFVLLQPLQGQLVGDLWSKALQDVRSGTLQQHNLPEIILLLQSAIDVQKGGRRQQQQQQQQWQSRQGDLQGLQGGQLSGMQHCLQDTVQLSPDASKTAAAAATGSITVRDGIWQEQQPCSAVEQTPPAGSVWAAKTANASAGLTVSMTTAALGAALVSAAAQRVLLARPNELQPRTAAVLLHLLAKLQRLHAICGAAPQATAAAVAAASVKLLGVLCGPGGTARLKDAELVMLAATAGHFAAAYASGTHNSSIPCSSDSGVCAPAAQPILRTAGDEAATLAATWAAATYHDGVTPSAAEGHWGAVLWTGVQALLQHLALPLAAVACTLKVRELATVVSSYAAAGVQAPELFDAVSLAVQRREILDHGSTWAFARLLAAYAAAEHADEQLFAAVVDVMMPRLPVLQARTLAKFSWALAAAGYHDRQVFRAIGAQLLGVKQAVQPVPGLIGAGSSSTSTGAATGVLQFLQPCDMAAISWALGTVGLRDHKPYLALAGAAVGQLNKFTASQLASLLWGLAAAGVYHAILVAAVSIRLVGRQHDTQQQDMQQQGEGQNLLHQQLNVAQQQQQQRQAISLPLLQGASAQDVATLAWALADLGAAPAAVMAACAQHFLCSAQQSSAADAADLAWALVWSGWAVQTAKTAPSVANTGLAGSMGICSATASCAGQSEGQVYSSGCSCELLFQLLHVAMADHEQLSPQQLANIALVTAVAAQSETAAAADKFVAAAGSNISNGSSSVGVGVQLDSLLTCLSTWDSGAFTAADGMKVLWALLLVRQQQWGKQQQSSQEQRRMLSQQDVTPLNKLLVAGARAALRYTSHICGSAFCFEVLTALQSCGFTVKLTVPTHQTAAAAIASSVGLARVPDEQADSVNKKHVWQQLGPEATAQLLGQVVVTMGPVNDAELQGVSRHATLAASSRHMRQQQHQQQQQVLLMLVPKGLCSKAPSMDSTAEGGLNAATTTATRGAEEADCQLLPGFAGLVATLLLPRQQHYRGVVLTQQLWERWSNSMGQQGRADALRHLVLNGWTTKCMMKARDFCIPGAGS